VSEHFLIAYIGNISEQNCVEIYYLHTLTMMMFSTKC